MNNKIIVLGGVGRSGTTILSKLIGTCKDVELFYEPKTIDLLFSLVNEIDENYWRKLFKRNLYDDLLVNSLSGRFINTNRHDDSSIFNYKAEQEIESRLHRSFGKLEVEQIAKKKVIAFKLLDTSLASDKVKEYFPSLSCLFIIRNPNDTLNSLAQKGWYSDEALSIYSPEPSSIFRIQGKMRIPNFVKDKDSDFWIGAKELERYAYYYVFMLEQMEKFKTGDHFFLDYDKFIKNPPRVFKEIKTFFNLESGELSENVLNTIKYQKKKRINLLNELPEHTQLKLLELYNQY